MAASEFLTEDQIDVISWLSGIVSGFSIVGSSFIVFCYLRFKHLRKFAFKLVFILSLTDLMNQLGDFMQPSSEEILRARQNVEGDTSALCYLQAYTESFFELASVLWTSAIAATLYMSVYMQYDTQKIESSFKWMMLTCWGLPLVLTILPGLFGAYGYAGAWCWIMPSYGGWRFVQFYIPLWVAVIFNGVVYVLIIRAVNNTLKLQANSQSKQAADMRRAMLNVINRLRYYPLILLVVWGWGTINRLYEIFSGKSLFWLFVLHKLFSSTQGLLNAFAYGMSATVRRSLVEAYPWLQKCCPCCCRSKGSSDDGEVSTSNPAYVQGVDSDNEGDGVATGDDAL